MPKSFKTQRLTVRPVTNSDFNFIRSLHTSPEVMKYIGGGITRTAEQTKTIMDKYLKLEEENPLLGGWIAFLTETNEPVGNLIIRKPATPEEIEGLEIGYSFTEANWGKGFATECARGMIEYAYREIGRVRLVALIEPTNEASRKTLEKVGFKSIGFTEYVDPSTGLPKPTEILEIPISTY